MYLGMPSPTFHRQGPLARHGHRVIPLASITKSNIVSWQWAKRPSCLLKKVLVKDEYKEKRISALVLTSSPAKNTTVNLSSRPTHQHALYVTFNLQLVNPSLFQYLLTTRSHPGRLQGTWCCPSFACSPKLSYPHWF